MGIIKRIFGSSENTETIVNGAVAGIDKLFFTKEEKSDANRQLADWTIKYLEASQPQNLARRLIAVIVVALWALLIVAGILVRPVSVELSDFIFKTLNELVHQPLMIIMGFYFLAHTIRAYQSGITNTQKETGK